MRTRRTMVGGLATAALLSALAACLPNEQTAQREEAPLALPLTRAQILDRLSGNTVYRSGTRGLAGWEYASRHNDNGTLSARMWWMGGDDRARGKWVVHDDGTYCRRWLNHWAQGEEGCFRAYSSPGDGSIIFDHVSGNPGDSKRYNYTVLAGNPYDL